MTVLQGIHVPTQGIPRREEDQGDEWNKNVNELCEWIGMACLGSPR
jgi:hypothetical protein